MKFFPSREVFLAIGSLEIRWYAVLILSGALLVYYICSKQMKKAGYDSDVMDDLFMYCMIAGIIGARLWYVLFSAELKDYLANPITILQIYNGGLAIHGGVVFGLITAWLYCKKKKLSFFHIADIIVPNVILAQAIGRWGNFANQECYGPIVPESFFNGILSFIKKGMYIEYHYRMPMFFFESVLCFLGWILIRLYKKRKGYRRGDGMFAYFAWYGAIRFWIESYRTDSLYIGPIKTAQLTSIIGLVIGMAGLLGLFKKFIITRKPLLVFDNDGTLVDTEEIIFRSFEHVLNKYVPELKLTAEDRAFFMGPTLYESFAKYAPNEDTEKLVAEYREYNLKILSESKPFPHVPEVLEQLKNEGYEMVIASSKKTSTVIAGLESTGLDRFIKAEDVIGLEMVTKPKPDKESIVRAYRLKGYGPDNVIYVGDSSSDIACGHNAGSYTVAYVSNKLKRAELENEKPNAIIDDFSELLEVLKGDHPWTSNLM